MAEKAEKASEAGAPPQTPLTDDDLRVIESNAGKMDSWAVDAQDVLALVAEVRRLRAALQEVVRHEYHGDKAKDLEGYYCLVGLQEEMRAVMDGVREPRAEHETARSK